MIDSDQQDTVQHIVEVRVCDRTRLVNTPQDTSALRHHKHARHATSSVLAYGHLPLCNILRQKSHSWQMMNNSKENVEKPTD